jgi:hypothetical protein
MSIKTPMGKISSDSFTRTQPLITVKQLKERYLFGIDLKDEQGNELPDPVIQHYIDSAVSFLEHKLDIIIFPTDFEEQYDYRAVDYTNFNFLQLKKRPVSEVTELKAKFPNNVDLVEYPLQWIVLEKEAGHVQLSPVEGTFSGLIITQGGSYIPLIYGSREYWPHLFRIKYKAGFEPDCIPTIINEMIGLQAAIRLFDIFGDLLLGPGIVNENVSIDAASVGKSKNVSGFSVRIESYRKSLTDYVDTVKKYYSGFSFVVA